MPGYLAAIYLKVTKALKISRKYRYFGMEIEVSPGVFDPFLLVSGKLLADSLNFSGRRVIEIGSGSGIVSLKLAKLGNEVIATEISEEAAKCTRRNAKRNGIELEVVLTEFAHGIEGEFDVMVANFPYFKGPRSLSPEIFSDEPFVLELLKEARRLRVKEIYATLSSRSPFLRIFEPYEKISEIKVPFERIFVIKKEIRPPARSSDHGVSEGSTDCEQEGEGGSKEADRQGRIRQIRVLGSENWEEEREQGEDRLEKF